jgi:hypothetical protein
MIANIRLIFCNINYFILLRFEAGKDVVVLQKDVVVLQKDVVVLRKDVVVCLKEICIHKKTI